MFQPWKTGSIALLTIALLASCSNGGTSGGSNSKETDAAKASNEPVELVFHSNSGDSVEAFDELYGNALRQKFPSYTIKYIRNEKGTALSDLMAQNQRIDILFGAVSHFMNMALPYGLQYDLSDLAKKHGVDLNKFQPTLIDGTISSGGGKLYGIPVTNMVQVLFYNKGIFDKFGVSYPKDGMTWDDAIEMAKKLTRLDGGAQYIGLAASPGHLISNNQLSLPYVDTKTTKPTYTDETWKKLIDVYFQQPAADEGYKARITQLKRIPYRGELTDSQDLAMFIFNSQFPFMVPKDVEKIQWDLVSLPTLSDKPGIGSQMAPYLFGVTNTAKNKDAAMEAIKYLISPEMQMSYSKRGIMPVIEDDSIKKAYGQDSAFKDKNWRAVFYNKPAPMAPKTQYQLLIEPFLNTVIVDAAKGTIDMNTALRAAQEKAEKAIAEEQRK